MKTAEADVDEEFIAVVRRWAFEDAVGESAIKPVGRMPHQALVTL